MSYRTLSRLPKHILHIFKIYERASNHILPYTNPRIRNYLQKSSEDYSNFQRNQLLTNNSSTGKFNSNDFPPILSSLIEPIFKDKLKLGPLEEMTTEEIFKYSQYEKDEVGKSVSTTDLAPISSTYNRTSKNFTDYQAQIATSFASYFTPYHSMPNSVGMKRSFQWYQRLLANTPIIFILRQTNRLLSESSLSQINKPLADLKQSIASLLNSLINKDIYNDDKNIRNYHLTDLTTVDIFSLAIKSQLHFQSDKEFEKQYLMADWNYYDGISDKLCDTLLSAKSVKLTDKSFNPVNINPEELVSKFPLHRVFRDLENTDVRDAFPYDIKYHDYYLLTIENPIIHEDHAALLNILNEYKDNFEVAAVRLGTNNESISQFISHEMHSKGPDTVSYDGLLQIAKSSHNTQIESHMDTLMKGLGELGLVKVEEGSSKNCIYLFHKH